MHVLAPPDRRALVVRARPLLLVAAVVAALVGAADRTGQAATPPRRPRHLRAADARHRPSRPHPTSDSIFPTEQIWQTDLDGILTAAPGYDAQQAYVPSRDGHLAAYVLVNGRKRWSIALPTTLPPVTGDHLVFVATTGAVVALHRDTGQIAWRRGVPGQITAPLTWDTGWLIAGTSDGTLLAWRARDGHLVWQVNLGAALSAPVSLGGRRVYVPLADNELVALDLSTGRRLWSQQFGGPPGPILPLDVQLFVGSHDKYFYCLNTANGHIRWQWRTGGDIVGAPVVDERRVYFTSLDNVLRALDRSSGTLQWQQALPLRPTSGPQLVAGDVIVSGTNPEVPAYRATDGTPLAGVQLGGELAAAPHVLPWGFTIGPSLIVATRSLTGPPQLHALARLVAPPLVPFGKLPGKKLSGY